MPHATDAELIQQKRLQKDDSNLNAILEKVSQKLIYNLDKFKQTPRANVDEVQIPVSLKPRFKKQSHFEEISKKLNH